MRIPVFAVLAMMTFSGDAFAQAFEVTTGASSNSYSSRPRVTTGWIGFAVSNSGRVFMGDPDTEARSRSAALGTCESMTQRTCQAIAVQPQADVTAIVCGSGSRQRSYVGGSNINRGAANWLALEKARNAGFSDGECRIVYTY